MQLNSVYVNFQDLWNKFSLIFRQLCDRKTCAFVVMRIGQKVVRVKVGWAEVLRQTMSFLLAFVGWRVGWVDNQASNTALAAKY